MGRYSALKMILKKLEKCALDIYRKNLPEITHRMRPYYGIESPEDRTAHAKNRKEA